MRLDAGTISLGAFLPPPLVDTRQHHGEGQAAGLANESPAGGRFQVLIGPAQMRAVQIWARRGTAGCCHLFECLVMFANMLQGQLVFSRGVSFPSSFSPTPVSYIIIMDQFLYIDDDRTPGSPPHLAANRLGSWSMILWARQVLANPAAISSRRRPWPRQQQQQIPWQVRKWQLLARCVTPNDCEP